MTTNTPAPSTDCTKCAEKILEFCNAAYPHDVALSFGPTKIATATGGFQYQTPATTPFIYSLENFKSNTVLCNHDEYITKTADLPECVGVNIQELNLVLKPDNIIIENPRPDKFHYFPFSSIVSTTIDINYYPVHYTFMKSMVENSRYNMRRRAVFCSFWRTFGVDK